MGLVDELVEREQLDQRCLEFAQKLTKGGRQALSITKHWLNELEGSLEDASFEKAAQISADVIVGDELRNAWANIRIQRPTPLKPLRRIDLNHPDPPQKTLVARMLACRSGVGQWRPIPCG